MKRRLLIIAVFLLLGAVVNVGVAWGCSAWGWTRPHTPSILLDRLAVQRVWDQYSPEGSPPFKEAFIATKWGWTVMVASPPAYDFAVGQLEVGLPLRTFRCGWHFEGDPIVGPVTPDKVVLFNGLRIRDRPPFLLPYEPIWPGIAVNTLFYVAVLWLLSVGPFALRRFLRLRRGLCPKCAYPVGESSVCTECGRALPSRFRVA